LDAAPKPSTRRPKIGVFDSGVGGLTVLRELLQRLPQADYFYFGDTARLPYGSKSVETVSKYAISAVQFLEQLGADRIVIACNTACALAYDRIVTAAHVPVTGVIEPGALRASGMTRNRHVLVIATEGTVGSHAYQRALAAWGIRADEKACPLFVPLVEEGWLEHPVTEQVAHIYLDEALAGSNADLVVLGCTHYPLLKPLLRRVLPAKIALLDSAETTAVAVAADILLVGMTASWKPPKSTGPMPEPEVHFFATDSVEKFRRNGEKFLGRTIANVQHVEIE
jgi:glutamate racemase